MPNQNPGKDTPNNDVTVAIRSRMEFLRTAASTPRGIETTSAKTSAARLSSMVAGRPVVVAEPEIALQQLFSSLQGCQTNPVKDENLSN